MSESSGCTQTMPPVQRERALDALARELLKLVPTQGDQHEHRH
jgi:hypothetical protein